MEVRDTYFRRAIDFFYGENACLYRQVPEEVGQKHINELLGRHPFHPYQPDMPNTHECKEINDLFYACMTHEDSVGYELHMKHVNCYFPYKVDLMKCLTSHNKKVRQNSTNGSANDQ